MKREPARFLRRERMSGSRRKAERGRESERIFRAVFDQAFQLMGLLRPDGTLVAANRTSLEFIRAEEAEVIGRPFWLTPWWTHSPEQQERLRQGIRAAAGGELVRFETTHPDHRGFLHHVDFSLKPVTDEEGRVFLLVPEGRDITERTLAEEKLRESEEKYRLLFSAEADAILIFDADTQEVEEVNEGATLLYGYAPEEFSGMSFRRITAEPEQLPERIGKVLAGELRRLPLVHHRKKDGTLFPAEISFGTFQWKGRRMVTEIVRDITERQKLEEMKDEMLSAVSHEMRTPLTAMLGFTEFLLEHEVEPERLKGLIDNLLTLQRLRAGFGVRSFEAVAIPPLLHGVAHLFQKSAADRRLVVDSPSDLPPLLGDEGKIQQAVENLVANAVKYSVAGGTITLGARREGATEVLWVRDEGPGIPAELQEQIFDRFFRIDSRDGRRIGGTGLGLPLVKEIARLHGGEVWLESAPGMGSTFFLRLPLGEVCWLGEEGRS